MTTDILHLNIDRAEGSLQRLIGLVERRGFEIEGLTVSGEGPGRRVRMAVTARDPNRCTETLGRCIDRLWGVTRLEAPAARREVAA